MYPIETMYIIRKNKHEAQSTIPFCLHNHKHPASGIVLPRASVTNTPVLPTASITATTAPTNIPIPTETPDPLAGAPEGTTKIGDDGQWIKEVYDAESGKTADNPSLQGNLWIERVPPE